MPREKSRNLPPMALGTPSAPVNVGQPFYSLDSLLAAYRATRRASAWKYSTHLFESELLFNLLGLSDDIAAFRYRVAPFRRFTVHERGNRREIQAACMRDRVLFRALADFVMLPAIRSRLIYDNYASLEGRGLSRARNRALTLLHRYYRRHGAKGYVLQCDFRKFFASIPHDKAIAWFSRYVTSPVDRHYMAMAIDCFGGDRGVGIGSTVSQVVGVGYLTQLDNFCKTVLGLKYYARYMDDFYIIHPDRAYLEQLRRGLGRYASLLGLSLNEGKTHITPLSHGFVFLKVHYFLTPSGAVRCKPCGASLTRERRRLRKLHGLWRRGALTLDHIRQCYRSWRGNLVTLYRGFAQTPVRRCDALFARLFGVSAA